MAVRNAAKKNPSDASGTTSDPIEEKIVAFAEQLGFLVGTIQAKAAGWLDRKTLSKEVSRIRDSAAALLDQVNRAGTSQRKPAAGPTTTTRRSRGPVDAPGKRHRKPPLQEPIDPHPGEPRGKQIGHKGAKAGRRGGRG